MAFVVFYPESFGKRIFSLIFVYSWHFFYTPATQATLSVDLQMFMFLIFFSTFVPPYFFIAIHPDLCFSPLSLPRFSSSCSSTRFRFCIKRLFEVVPPSFQVFVVRGPSDLAHLFADKETCFLALFMKKPFSDFWISQFL